MKELNEELKKYEEQLFKKQMEKSLQLGELQREMGMKRQVQADQMKEELKRTVEGFDRERTEWKYIIQQFENENGKIKKDWQEEKIKYV